MFHISFSGQVETLVFITQNSAVPCCTYCFVTLSMILFLVIVETIEAQCSEEEFSNKLPGQAASQNIWLKFKRSALGRTQCLILKRLQETEEMGRSGLHSRLGDGKELGGKGWLTQIQAPQGLALPLRLFHPGLG